MVHLSPYRDEPSPAACRVAWAGREPGGSRRPRRSESAARAWWPARRGCASRRRRAPPAAPATATSQVRAEPVEGGDPNRVAHECEQDAHADDEADLPGHGDQPPRWWPTWREVVGRASHQVGQRQPDPDAADSQAGRYAVRYAGYWPIRTPPRNSERRHTSEPAMTSRPGRAWAATAGRPPQTPVRGRARPRRRSRSAAAVAPDLLQPQDADEQVDREPDVEQEHRANAQRKVGTRILGVDDRRRVSQGTEGEEGPQDRRRQGERGASRPAPFLTLHQSEGEQADRDREQHGPEQVGVAASSSTARRRPPAARRPGCADPPAH